MNFFLHHPVMEKPESLEPAPIEEDASFFHPRAVEIRDLLLRELSALWTGNEGPYTQAELAKRCKMTQQEIGRFLRPEKSGRGKNPSLNATFKIWEGLGHAIEDICRPTENVIYLNTARISRKSDVALVEKFAAIISHQEEIPEKSFMESIRDDIERLFNKYLRTPTKKKIKNDILYACILPVTAHAIYHLLNHC